MALFKANDTDTVTVSSSGSVTVDAGKLLSLKKVQDELVEFDNLYLEESKRRTDVKLVPRANVRAVKVP